jgi:hypothetical protein
MPLFVAEMAMTQIRVDCTEAQSKNSCGSTPLDVPAASARARAVVAARVDGQLVDLSHRLEADARLELDFGVQDGLEIPRPPPT